MDRRKRGRVTGERIQLGLDGAVKNRAMRLDRGNRLVQRWCFGGQAHRKGNVATPHGRTIE